MDSRRKEEEEEEGGGREHHCRRGRHKKSPLSHSPTQPSCGPNLAHESKSLDDSYKKYNYSTELVHSYFWKKKKEKKPQQFTAKFLALESQDFADPGQTSTPPPGLLISRAVSSPSPRYNDHLLVIIIIIFPVQSAEEKRRGRFGESHVGGGKKSRLTPPPNQPTTTTTQLLPPPSSSSSSSFQIRHTNTCVLHNNGWVAVAKGTPHLRKSQPLTSTSSSPSTCCWVGGGQVGRAGEGLKTQGQVRPFRLACSVVDNRYKN